MYLLAGQVLGALLVFALMFFGFRPVVSAGGRWFLAIVAVLIWWCLSPYVGFPQLLLR